MSQKCTGEKEKRGIPIPHSLLSLPSPTIAFIYLLRNPFSQFPRKYFIPIFDLESNQFFGCWFMPIRMCLHLWCQNYVLISCVVLFSYLCWCESSIWRYSRRELEAVHFDKLSIPIALFSNFFHVFFSSTDAAIRLSLSPKYNE